MLLRSYERDSDVLQRGAAVWKNRAKQSGKRLEYPEIVQDTVEVEFPEITDFVRNMKLKSGIFGFQKEDVYEKMQQLNKMYQSRAQQMRDQNRGQLKQMRRQQQEEIEDMKARLAAERAQEQQKLAEEREKQEAERAELQAQMEKERAELKEQAEKEQQVLKEKFDAEQKEAYEKMQEQGRKRNRLRSETKPALLRRCRKKPISRSVS